MSFDVSITAETGRPFVPFLRTNLRAAHAALESRQPRGRRVRGLPLREMSLALVGDRRMSELHHQFMGIHGPTDVLTFPIDADPRGRVTAGEVIVCVPEAKRQAKRRKIPPRLELLLYSLHGMLHLLGHDDRTPRDFARMHRTEDDILTALGFGPVFAAADRAFAKPPASAGGPPRRRTGRRPR